MHGNSYSLLLMSSTFYVAVMAPSGGNILLCLQYKVHKFCRKDNRIEGWSVFGSSSFIFM